MRPVRTRLALLLGALAALGATALAVAAPARAAAGNCPFNRYWDGDRVCRYAAGSGTVQWTVLHVFTGPDGHDRATGEAFGLLGSEVFLEVSRDGGRTYTGWVDAGSQGGPNIYDHMYTSDAAYDGPGYWVRACATSSGENYVCTGWN